MTPQQPPSNYKALELIAQFEETTRSLGLESIAAAVGQPLKSHTELTLDLLLTNDPKMLEIKARVRKLAPSNLSILILGETGTGKELIANALHGERAGDFIAINCGAIPPDLLEGELFGAEKGAYTGAITRKGLIERADKGTLFLDEIGEMPVLLQCKLLRFLQEKRFRRVGGVTEIAVDFRLVSATNMMELDKTLRFRADLYYRLAGHIIKIPPLRQRDKMDIALIISCLCENLVLREKILLHVQDLDLKGNVRQLKNVIEEFKALEL